jgi:hypothetical protein
MRIDTPLDRMDTLYRIHYATLGVVSHIMTLVRSAQRIALRNGCDAISMADLSAAFTRHLFALMRVPDPFTGAHVSTARQGAESTTGTRGGGQRHVDGKRGGRHDRS